MKNFVFVLFCFCSVVCFSQSYPYGKVRVVNSRADYKVRVVNVNADLKVEKVNAYADRQGRWQFVDAFEDFTVEFVNAFEDFTIEYVDHVNTSYPAPNSHNVTVYGGGGTLPPVKTYAYDVDAKNCRMTVNHSGTLKQFPLCAKVKIVDSDADVLIYDSSWEWSSDIYIDTTNATPTECCQWQFVDSCYDFTVQFVKDLNQPFDVAVCFCYRLQGTSFGCERGFAIPWENKKR